MKQIFSGQRFLVIYSGLLTAAVVVTLLTGFDAQGRKPKFEEITVQRINVVEPDGTLRLVISNQARFPGWIMKGREFLRGRREASGMLFFNNEGSETGGLTWGGLKDENGVEHATGHLSFDGYMQDQLITMTAGQTGQRRSAVFNVNDQPFWNITELLQLLERIIDLPPEEQQAAIEEFYSTHPTGQNRIVFGRGGDQSVALAMKDPQGRPRIIMQVAPDGSPVLQFLNADGEVIAQVPE